MMILLTIELTRPFLVENERCTVLQSSIIKKLGMEWVPNRTEILGERGARAATVVMSKRSWERTLCWGLLIHLTFTVLPASLFCGYLKRVPAQFLALFLLSSYNLPLSTLSTHPWSTAFSQRFEQSSCFRWASYSCCLFLFPFLMSSHCYVITNQWAHIDCLLILHSGIELIDSI